MTELWNIRRAIGDEVWLHTDDSGVYVVTSYFIVRAEHVHNASTATLPVFVGAGGKSADESFAKAWTKVVEAPDRQMVTPETIDGCDLAIISATTGRTLLLHRRADGQRAAVRRRYLKALGWLPGDWWQAGDSLAPLIRVAEDVPQAVLMPVRVKGLIESIGPAARLCDEPAHSVSRESA